MPLEFISPPPGHSGHARRTAGAPTLRSGCTAGTHAPGSWLDDGSVHHSSDVPVHVRLPHPVTQVAQGGSIWNNGQTLVMLSDGSLWS
jgi:hypothetical protein